MSAKERIDAVRWREHDRKSKVFVILRLEREYFRSAVFS